MHLTQDDGGVIEASDRPATEVTRIESSGVYAPDGMNPDEILACTDALTRAFSDIDPYYARAIVRVVISTLKPSEETSGGSTPCA